MCIEVVRIYTCDCEEIEEIIFCEITIYPEGGHCSGGEPSEHRIEPIMLSEKCSYCAIETARREQEEAARIKEETIRHQEVENNGVKMDSETRKAGDEEGENGNEGVMAVDWCIYQGIGTADCSAGWGESDGEENW